MALCFRYDIPAWRVLGATPGLGHLEGSCFDDKAAKLIHFVLLRDQFGPKNRQLTKKSPEVYASRSEEICAWLKADISICRIWLLPLSRPLEADEFSATKEFHCHFFVASNFQPIDWLFHVSIGSSVAVQMPWHRTIPLSATS